MAKHDNRMPIQTALGYVEEARAASRDWRAKSWRDHEMYDGDQWTPEDRQRAVDAGIDPLTINRIFPAINLILGSQELNRANIIAKARTAKDGQIAEIMTEALAFVLDQNDGQYRIGQAFKDAVIPGIGWLYCGFNNDPRQERIKLDFRDWKEVFWDPFASPWLESDKCRYAFFQRWMDLFDLQCLYPEREKEIGEAFSGLSAHDSDYSYMDDEADIVEQDKRVLGRHHVEVEGKAGLAGVHLGERLAGAERRQDRAVAPVVLLLQPHRPLQHQPHARGHVAHAQHGRPLWVAALACAQAVQQRLEVVVVDAVEQRRAADDGKMAVHRSPSLELQRNILCQYRRVGRVRQEGIRAIARHGAASGARRREGRRYGHHDVLLPMRANCRMRRVHGRGGCVRQQRRWKTS